MKKINSKYIDTKKINYMIDDYNKKVEQYLIKKNKEVADLNNELVNTFKKVIESSFELEEPFKASRFSILCIIGELIQTATDTYTDRDMMNEVDKLLDKLLDKLFGE